jgi:hypothetical protein
MVNINDCNIENLLIECIERHTQNEEIILIQHAMINGQTNNLDVSMISQFSVNRLDTFKKAIEAWTGPISVAMYVKKKKKKKKIRICTLLN